MLKLGVEVVAGVRDYRTHHLNSGLAYKLINNVSRLITGFIILELQLSLIERQCLNNNLHVEKIITG